jgi:hypothetical protein
MLKEAVDIEAGFRSKYILWLHKDVFNKRGGNNAQGNLAINATEGEIVNLVTEWRNICPFSGVNADCENIFAIKI